MVIQDYFAYFLFFILPVLIPCCSLLINVSKSVKKDFLIISYLFPFIPVLAYFVNSSLIKSRPNTDKMNNSEIGFLIVLYIWFALAPQQLVCYSIFFDYITGNHSADTYAYLFWFLFFTIPLALISFFIGILRLSKGRS